MFDLTIIRRVLEKEVSKMDTRKEHLGEALIFLERLEQEDYRDDEELENFELDSAPNLAPPPRQIYTRNSA